MDPNETVVVYITNDTTVAAIVSNALAKEGIKAHLDSTSQGGFTELVEVKVLVHAADEDRARRIIEEHEG